MARIRPVMLTRLFRGRSLGGLLPSVVGQLGAADPKLLDGALFAYVLGTDPEAVLVLEAIGTAEKADWQYASGLRRMLTQGIESQAARQLTEPARTP
jgi:hypothetical protein